MYHSAVAPGDPAPRAQRRQGPRKGRAVTIPRGFDQGPCPADPPHPTSPRGLLPQTLSSPSAQEPDSRSGTATAQCEPPQIGSTPASWSPSVHRSKAREEVDTWFGQRWPASFPVGLSLAAQAGMEQMILKGGPCVLSDPGSGGEASGRMFRVKGGHLAGTAVTPCGFLGA